MQQPTPPSAPRAAQIASTPRTRAELDALVQLRSELRDQLSSLTRQRGELLPQQRFGSEASRPITATRIATLDARSARIEEQIRATDEAIAAGLASGLAVQAPEAEQAVTTIPPARNDQVGFERVMFFNGFGLLLLGAIVWLTLRRRFRGNPAPALADQSRRLEQLQQAVDTMAVEVERISEGQRFVAKLLNERLQPAVGAGDAQPVPVKRAESVPARDAER